MGHLFNSLCKGPVVIIDDKIGESQDPINSLITELKKNDLLIKTYRHPIEAKNEISNLLMSNFFIIDWDYGQERKYPGVHLGSTAQSIDEEEVINIIKRIQKVCLGPVFILTSLPTEGIISKLTAADIPIEGERYVFIDNKQNLREPGKLISKIEEWLKTPHIYLSKWWINEWLSGNIRLFWDLCSSNPNWPSCFYHEFDKDGDDPILALRDTLIQLILSEIDITTLDESLFSIEIPENPDELDSLKKLYQRLVYTKNNIEKNNCPGDIYKIGTGKEVEYYLNIRPECDTTKRVRDPCLYLLKGKAESPSSLRDRYNDDYGKILERAPEIIMILLDNNNLVRFDKRDLIIKKVSELKSEGYEKICRVTHPFISMWRQSYMSFLGRFGVPSYPRKIIDSLFNKNS